MIFRQKYTPAFTSKTYRGKPHKSDGNIYILYLHAEVYNTSSTRERALWLLPSDSCGLPHKFLK